MSANGTTQATTYHLLTDNGEAYEVSHDHEDATYPVSLKIQEGCGQLNFGPDDIARLGRALETPPVRP